MFKRVATDQLFLDEALRLKARVKIFTENVEQQAS